MSARIPKYLLLPFVVILLALSTSTTLANHNLLSESSDELAIYFVFPSAAVTADNNIPKVFTSSSYSSISTNDWVNSILAVPPPLRQSMRVMETSTAGSKCHGAA